MDRDFHFGATYNAAKSVGFTREEALVIARAAQYVDEFDAGAYRAVSKTITDGTEIAQTVQSTGELGGHDLANWRGVDSRTAHIWPVFHFLPGFYNPFDLLTETGTDEDLMPLVCRPYGYLTTILLDEARRKWTKNGAAQPDPATGKDKKLSALIRIGITMHVLADTFAHANFVGLPAQEINEVGEITDERAEGGKLTIYPAKDYSPAFFSSGYGYLGHGRIGHLPDEAWQFYTYQNAWQSGGVSRDNPGIYAEALLYLEEAFKYIRGDVPAIPRAQSDLHASNDVIDATKHFFRNGGDSVRKQEAHWQELNEGAAYVPPSLKEDRAFMLAFGRQARKHRELVLAACEPLAEILNSSRITG